MKMKVENWNNHEIRFVEKEPGDWWAVLADIANALQLRTDKIASRLEKDNLSKVILETSGGMQEMNIINEYGIYEAVFESRKKEAKAFKRWVFEILKTLRQASDLEGFQIFRMLDKEHQKEAMKRLQGGLHLAARIDYIKANTIADKAISTKRGSPKMVKKNDMPADWLPERQPILDDTVDLMAANDRFGLGVSVSGVIYRRHCG